MPIFTVRGSAMSAPEIRDLRAQLGMTGQELADALNAYRPRSLKADRNIVSRWERGEYTPNQHYQCALYRLAGDAVQASPPAASTPLPPGESMDMHALADLIREHGPREIADIVGRPERKVLEGMREGWDLIDWEVDRSLQGIAYFYRRPRYRAPANPEIAHLRAELALREGEAWQLKIVGHTEHDDDRARELAVRMREITRRLEAIDPEAIAAQLNAMRALPEGFPGREDRIADWQTRYDAVKRPSAPPIDAVIYVHTDDRERYREAVETSPNPVIAIYKSETPDANRQP